MSVTPKEKRSPDLCVLITINSDTGVTSSIASGSVNSALALVSPGGNTTTVSGVQNVITGGTVSGTDKKTE